MRLWAIGAEAGVHPRALCPIQFSHGVEAQAVDTSRWVSCSQQAALPVFWSQEVSLVSNTLTIGLQIAAFSRQVHCLVTFIRKQFLTIQNIFTFSTSARNSLLPSNRYSLNCSLLIVGGTSHTLALSHRQKWATKPQTNVCILPHDGC